MLNHNIVYYTIINKKDIKCSNNNTLSDTKKAQLVLKEMLDYLNIKMPIIKIDSNGKPYFAKSNIYFNYSHTKNYIACAISLANIGIDIEEKNREINDDIARKYLDNAKTNLKRIETWVKKESYSKLIGLGLQIKLQSINLNEITFKNFFINKKEYLCSIYCDNNEAKLKIINIKLKLKML